MGKDVIKLLGYILENLCNNREMTDRNFNPKLNAYVTDQAVHTRHPDTKQFSNACL